jgi:hypothetical protein
LPSGPDLSEYLAQACEYPKEDADGRKNLLRVSQYFEIKKKSGPLYDKLHGLFDADYPVTPLHTFLARLPGFLAADGLGDKPLLIATTNYDDLMERALQAAGRPYDLVAYMARGEHGGRFVHWPPGGAPYAIPDASQYLPGFLKERSVILKLHGLVDRAGGTYDSYVIAEDHYIDFLSHLAVADLIPIELRDKLCNSCVLFLGYSLSDWNLRVILHRIWGSAKLDWPAWAIQVNPNPVEARFWEHRGVHIHDVALDWYVEFLEKQWSRVPVPGQSREA